MSLSLARMKRTKTLQRRRLDRFIGERLAQKGVEHVVRLAAEPRAECAPAAVRTENRGEEAERRDLVGHGAPGVQLHRGLPEALVL